MAIVNAAVTLLLSALYEVGFTSLTGATPGKMMLGFRVVDSTGKTPLKPLVAVLRWAPFGVLIGLMRLPLLNIIGALGFLGLSIAGLVTILVSAKRQAPWDIIASTYVVVDPSRVVGPSQAD